MIRAFKTKNELVFEHSKYYYGHYKENIYRFSGFLDPNSKIFFSEHTSEIV